MFFIEYSFGLFLLKPILKKWIHIWKTMDGSSPLFFLLKWKSTCSCLRLSREEKLRERCSKRTSFIMHDVGVAFSSWAAKRNQKNSAFIKTEVTYNLVRNKGTLYIIFYTVVCWEIKKWACSCWCVNQIPLISVSIRWRIWINSSWVKVSLSKHLMLHCVNFFFFEEVSAAFTVQVNFKVWL